MTLPLIHFDPHTVGIAIPSPCIRVCHLQPISGLCDGCQRTLDEIVGWASAGDAGQRKIWQRINQRRLR